MTKTLDLFIAIFCRIYDKTADKNYISVTTPSTSDYMLKFKHIISLKDHISEFS